MARSKSASGLSEIWVPKDVVTCLGSIRPADLMVYLYAIEISINTTGEIPRWVHARAARAVGCSVAVAAASYTRLVGKKLIEPVTGPRGKAKHPRVTVRVGTGKSSVRLPRVAIWAGPLDDGPRWGKNSGDAARTILALLNQMDHKSPNPTMHFPHDYVAAGAGLTSSVYRLGIPLLTDEPWVDVTKRWRVAGQDFGPVSGVQRDSSQITFRWAVLQTAVEDRQALMALADAQKAHLTAAKSAILSTEPVDSAAGEPVDSAAGEPVDSAAGIFTFSCQHVLLSSSTHPSISCPVCADTQPPTQPTNGEGGVHKNEETKEQAIAPATLPLTIANVINAKSRNDVKLILQAVYDRCNGWWPERLEDHEWVAAVIAAIVWAPIGHELKLTVAEAEQLAQDFLPRKADYWTPHAVAVALVGPSLNRDVRKPVATLRYRLDRIPPDPGLRGQTQHPKALLTTQDLVPNKIAAQYRGEDASTKSARVRGTKSTRPHNITRRYPDTLYNDDDVAVLVQAELMEAENKRHATFNMNDDAFDPTRFVRASDGTLWSTTFD